jgi:hypothetical protein
MQQERRGSRRTKFIDNPRGLFSLAVGSNQHEVMDVIDVSVTGIGLEMGVYLDPGRMVRVIYRDDDATMYASGTVIRCENTGQDRYRVGVVFDYPHREESNRFYVKVRTFLEPGDPRDGRPR